MIDSSHAFLQNQICVQSIFFYLFIYLFVLKDQIGDTCVSVIILIS
jgi:hypothetical protein